MSRSRASEGSSSTAKGIPASRAAATWRARLPSPKDGRIASGGREQEGVGPLAVAVGDDGDVALGNAGQEAVELAWVEQRAVAGKQHDAVGALRFGAGDAGEGGLDVAGVGGVGDDLGPGVRGQLLGGRGRR